MTRKNDKNKNKKVKKQNAQKQKSNTLNFCMSHYDVVPVILPNGDERQAWAEILPISESEAGIRIIRLVRDGEDTNRVFTSIDAEAEQEDEWEIVDTI